MVTFLFTSNGCSHFDGLAVNIGLHCILFLYLCVVPSLRSKVQIVL